MQTRVRAEVVVGGKSFALARDQDVDDLKREIQEAAVSAGRFVDIRGERSSMSVFVSRGVNIAVVTETESFEQVDSDIDAPVIVDLYDD